MRVDPGARAVVGFIILLILFTALGAFWGVVYLFRLDAGHVLSDMTEILHGKWDAVGVVVIAASGGAIAGGILGLGGMVTLGLPAFSFSIRRGCVTATNYLVGGVSISAAVLLILFVIQSLYSAFPQVETWFEAVAILSAGPVGAWTFWKICRPDRA